MVYSPQATPATVNNQIRKPSQPFFANQYFGNVIRSERPALAWIHNVAGVENVRWSNDVPNDPSLVRVQQTNIDGMPLEGIFLDRIPLG